MSELKVLELQKRIQNVKNMCDIQSERGNWDSSDYMRGVANGLILAVAVLENNDPDLFEPPIKPISTSAEKGDKNDNRHT